MVIPNGRTETTSTSEKQRAASARRQASGPGVSAKREWSISSDVANIEPVVSAIVRLCAEAGFSPQQCRLHLPVAITEALANAMLRANGNDATRLVQVTVSFESHRVIVEVDDQGAGFDVALVQESPEDADWLEREDGRGVFLMRQLMDHVESLPLRGGLGHRLRLELRKP